MRRGPAVQRTHRAAHLHARATLLAHNCLKDEWPHCGLRGDDQARASALTARHVFGRAQRFSPPRPPKHVKLPLRHSHTWSSFRTSCSTSALISKLGPFDEKTNVAMSAICAIAVLARLQSFHDGQGQQQNRFITTSVSRYRKNDCHNRIEAKNCVIKGLMQSI